MSLLASVRWSVIHYQPCALWAILRYHYIYPQPHAIAWLLDVGIHTKQKQESGYFYVSRKDFITWSFDPEPFNTDLWGQKRLNLYAVFAPKCNNLSWICVWLKVALLHSTSSLLCIYSIFIQRRMYVLVLCLHFNCLYLHSLHITNCDKQLYNVKKAHYIT